MKFLAIAAMMAAASTSQIAGGLIDYSWGMTPEQVATSSNGAIPLGDGGLWIDSRDPENRLEYKARNTGTITVFDRTMETGYYYIDEKLAQIRTYRKEACPDFRTKLKARYGDPVKEEEYSSGYYATWIDAASKTEIRHSASGECRVFFVRIE